MWYPEVSLSTWFKINPFLKNSYPLTCLCGIKKYNVKPYVTKTWIGIVSEQCICGVGEITSSIPRNDELNEKINQSMKNFTMNLG